jgi:class 3 adenylate cyclase/WD40 repeat protein
MAQSKEDGPAPASVRSFLVADIRGYTSYTAAHGDEAAARLVEHFAAIVSDGVTAWSGTLVELRGDEALAAFESPRAAIRAAVELQAAFADESRDDPDRPLNVGIGLDAGEAVPVSDGYRGGALNRAARLCSVAAAGQTLASEELIHLAGPVTGIDYEPPRQVRAKGLDEPVGVVAVAATPVDLSPRGPALTLATPTSIPPQLDPVVPLAGRLQEVGWLRWHWRRARHGHSRTVVVSGVPGIGKTRLAAALAAIAHVDGGAITYLPTASGITEAALATKSHGRPALLVVDDIDAAPSDLVKTTVDEAEALDGPVLLLVTHRTEASAELLRSLVDLTPPSMRRELGPLDLDAVRMIASLYAGDAVDELPLGEIAEQTDGHPASVHRVSHEWARRLAIHRVGSSAGRAESDRRDLREAEAALMADISLLEQARESGLLYDDRADLVTPGADAGTRPRSVCPYKGLEPYDAADADLFFGRERLVAELTSRLVGSPFLAIVGASGSGKSSVIEAGLLPSLAAGALPSSDTWAQVSMRPGDQPSATLSQALCQRFDGLCDEPIGADEAMTKALAILPHGGRLILFIDQFEEVFACPDAADRAAFIDTICGEHPGLLVIVALRADHYGHAAAYPALARLIASHHVLVGTLTRSELVTVIARPAELVGLHVEPELVDALVADTGAEPSVLPLLSTALLEAWTLRDGNRLMLAAYEAGGGLHGSVARLAEGVWTSLDPDRQAVARAILLRLAGTSEAEGFVRRRVPLSEFDLDADPMVADVLERLVTARLLTTDDETVEVTHEALLREWPRLREWLEEDASGHQLHMHLAAAARQWNGDGRPAGDLYRGARLAGAMDWSAEHPEQLNAVEREFLDASSAATEAEAERQRKTNRNLRLLVAGIGVLLVAAVGAGIFASLEAQRAEEETRRAEAETRRAEAEADRAERERQSATASALVTSSILEIDSDPSLAKLLALQAANTETKTDVLSGLHATLAADRVEQRVPITHAETGQRSWAVVDPSGRWVVMAGPRTQPRGSMEVFDLETDVQEPVWTFEAKLGALVSLPRFTPDGTRLVAGVYALDGSLTEGHVGPPAETLGIGVWRTPTDDALDWDLTDLIHVGPCGARMEDVSDQNVLIELPADADSACFDPSYEEPSSLEIVGFEDQVARRLTEVFLVANPRDLLSADGGAAVFGDAQLGQSVVIDTETLVERWTAAFDDAWPVALSTDGSLLLVEGRSGMEVRDITSGQLVSSFPHPGGIGRGHFRPGDDAVVATGWDRTLTLWDARSGENLGTYPATGEHWPQSFGDRIGAVDWAADVPALVIVDPEPRGESLAVQLCADDEDRAAFVVGARTLEMVDGRPLLVAECERGSQSTLLLDAMTGSEDLRVDGARGHVQAPSPDGRWLARQEDPGPGDWEEGTGPVVIRDLESGEALITLDPVCQELPSEGDCTGRYLNMDWMDWSSDGRYLAGGGWAGLAVWDTTSGQAVLATPRNDDEMERWDVAFSPDGERLLVSWIIFGTDSVTIDEYSTETWELMRQVPVDTEAPDASLMFVGWSPDGSVLYGRGGADTGSGNETLLWLDAETLEKRGSAVTLHDDATAQDALSPDGTHLATASVSGEVRIWDLAERSVVHEIQLESILPDQVPAGIGWKDDTRVMVVTEPGTLIEFTTDADELIGLVSDSLTRGFTDAECARYDIDPCPSLDDMRAG